MNLIEKLRGKSSSMLNGALFGIAFLITIVSILTGSYVHDKENVKVGMISPKRYVAPRDTVDTAATQKLKEEAAASVGPLYKHDTNVQETTLLEIDDFFKDVEKVVESAQVADGVVTYSKDAVLKIPVALNEKQYRIYGELTQTGKESFQKDIKDTITYVYDQGVTEESMTKALSLAGDKLNETSWNSELKNMSYLIVSAALKPNLVLDLDAMDAAKEQKMADVEDVMIWKNQKIVDEGEVITQDIYTVLEELNLINVNVGETMVPMFGSIAIVCLLFGVVFFYLRDQYPKMVIKNDSMLLLFSIYILTILILRITAEFSIFMVIPLAVFPMLVSILLRTRLAMELNVFVCIIGLFIYNGGLDYLLYFLVTGSAGALLAQYTKKRKHIVTVAAAIGLADFFSFAAVGLFLENSITKSLLYGSIYAGITGLLSVVVVIGSLPLWEAVFDVNTPVKLLELINPNNELLRRLMLEAPGTYHHSLIVANLAERACYEVEANAALARVGAYYHDIGKLKYPLYFGENQAGSNPHDNLDPYNSAKMIQEHVRYGKVLAEEYKLPKMVQAFIGEHHGTTLIKYFYFMAVKKYTKEGVDEKDFRYPGPIPQSKETAIVMLADTIEAAVRSTISTGKDLKEVEDLISSLIQDKVLDGQLDDCGLTMKDLKLARKAFLNVFQGMYHDRIAYPNMKELEKKKDSEEEKTPGEEEKNDASH